MNWKRLGLTVGVIAGIAAVYLSGVAVGHAIGFEYPWVYGMIAFPTCLVVGMLVTVLCMGVGHWWAWVTRK